MPYSHESEAHKISFLVENVKNQLVIGFDEISSTENKS